MRVMTVLGTRPEIIRLSRIIPVLDKLCDHVLVHTGQNYDPKLSDVFFKDLGLRKPDHQLEIGGGWFATQAARVLSDVAHVLDSTHPDRVLILGDTNSGLCAIVAKRMGIPVYHLEAGNRCYDDCVPEEINRRIIDHCSDVLMPYTERSRANLLREGIEGQRVFVVGNPIYEVLQHYTDEINDYGSDVLKRLGLVKHKYLLATIHRAENVDVEARLESIMKSLALVAENHEVPIVCSLHPHTRERLKDFDRDFGIRFIDPLGFFDFVALEQNATCVLTDSGTVQEECCIQHIPAVVIRDVTERPETVECGATVMSGVNAGDVQQLVATAIAGNTEWTVPAEYVRPNVSQAIANIVLGK